MAGRGRGREIQWDNRCSGGRCTRWVIWKGLGKGGDRRGDFMDFMKGGGVYYLVPGL